MNDISFAELDLICKRIISSSIAESTALLATPPAEKLALNGLGMRTEKKIRLGLMQAPQVSLFLTNMATHVDADFPARLVAGFRMEYQRWWEEGLRGDDLFLLIEMFATGGAQDFEKQAAGLAVIAHLFQVCDLFEAA
ncbi:hypothetical protein GCM10022252_07910 [Streptosporangium oxazolinicum]|uniref:Uncharacterized protein n=2 Tax=Streptosporangium oxazolinicum TaxID=909287 RepID=A0ABP8ADQ2_9ACTN